LDANQVAFFKDRYSSMSDEELTNLLIGRHERLSEEANEALTAVLKQKDPAKLMREVEEKVEDLNSQSRAAAAAVQRQREHNKRSRRALLLFFVAVALVLATVAFLR
jgi:beta-phosphoglucomutase-like phosphatase (HAD superfamily)